YNILAVGIRPDKNQSMWSYGYGLGSELPLSDKLVFNIDVIANQVNKTSEGAKYLNLLNQVKLQVGYKIGNKTTVFGGPTINIQTTYVPEHELDYYDLSPYS